MHDEKEKDFVRADALEALWLIQEPPPEAFARSLEARPDFLGRIREGTPSRWLALDAKPVGCRLVLARLNAPDGARYAYSLMSGQVQKSLRSPRTLFRRPTAGQNLAART